ncbi:MAG: hypothetical protein IJA85_05730 [Clostridia bacterium]|nr:hypothetical protein [Clostridia bacterium]
MILTSGKITLEITDKMSIKRLSIGDITYTSDTCEEHPLLQFRTRALDGSTVEFSSSDAGKVEIKNAVTRGCLSF